MHVIHESECPDIGPVCAEREEPPQLHDQMFYIAELRSILEYGLTENISVEMQLPLKLSRTTVQYRRLDGTVFEPDYVNIHHRNETLFGIGDPWVSGRIHWRIGSLQLAGRVGVSLPLGTTEENPFALGRAGLEHQHIQFGTGTFNPLLALEGDYPVGRLTLRGYAQAQLVLYENAKGFRSGDRYGGGVSGEGVVIGGLRASASVDVISEQPERWDGSVQQDGNLGRTDLLVGISVAYPVGDFRLRGEAKVPVYQKVIESGDHEGGQLTYPAIISLTLSRTFGVN